jgi:hypothetical protein
MSFWFRLGGPQVGAVRALVLMAGVMTLALVVPGPAPASDISIVPDQARLRPLPERIATVAIGKKMIACAKMRADGSAPVRACGGGWAQRDRGRFNV